MVDLWSQGDREFVLQQAKTICDSTSGKLYVAKYLNAAQLAVIKEVRSKCADFNRNAAPCSDGRARYVVINDKIRKLSNNGKLEIFADTAVSTSVASKSISDTSVKSANANVTVITSESIVQAPDASKKRSWREPLETGCSLPAIFSVSSQSAAADQSEICKRN